MGKVEICYIIEERSSKPSRRLLIASHGESGSQVKLLGNNVRFWDAVGDMMLSLILEKLQHDAQFPEKTLYLLSDDVTKEGSFYSWQTIITLSEKAGCRLIIVSDRDKLVCYDDINSERKWKLMAETVNLPSLSDYRKRLEMQSTPNGQILDAQAEQPSEGMGISPFSSSKQAKVSESARQNALKFAHPVDQSIIKALNNPAVNSVFNKVVQASIDTNYGLALARGIHVSPNIYPDLYDIIVECANKLGIPVPYVVISDTVQGINACTAGTDQFAFIAISSFLPIVMNREELLFVIGHECGHLALGHVVYHTALNVIGTAGGLLPVVGPIIEKTIRYPLNAWSRRSEISADRAGLICCGDIEIAKRTLFKLEAGLLRVDNVDIDRYVREAEQVLDNTTIGKLSEFAYSHPIIPKRIKALDYFASSQTYNSITGLGDAGGRHLLTDDELASKVEQIIEIKL